MGILVALLPALCWGMVAVISTKLGGTPSQQVVGMSLGALLLGALVFLVYIQPNHIFIDSKIWLVGLFSGLFWAVGMFGQLNAFQDMGVSIALPLSTAGQIITNALMGAAVLGEWKTGTVWFFGLISIALVSSGAMLTSVKPKGEGKTPRSANFKRGALYLIISTIGYMLYFVFPNLMVKMGYISQAIHQANHGADYMAAVVLPQSVGQLLGSILIVILFMHASHEIFTLPTAKNTLTGLDWAVGNLFMFVSAANPAIGQAMATTLSQMGVVIGTFGGIYILHEKKTSYQMRMIILGSILVVVGSILISNLDVVSRLI